MNFPLRSTVVAAAVALAYPATLLADEKQNQNRSGASGSSAAQERTQQQGSQRRMNPIQASDLKDMKVVDRQGKELGEISEIVVDLGSGRVHAAVVEFGGFLGMGEKQYAFPVSQLKAGQQRERLVLDVDRAKLKDAQGFDKRQWPAMGDEYWGRVGGGEPAAAGKQAKAGKQASGGKPAAQQGAMKLVRVSELVGTQVRDKNGEEAGEVQNVLLDLRAGRVAGIVLDVEGGGRARLQPNALSAGVGDELVTSMTREQLRSRAAQRDRRADDDAGRAATGASRIPPGNGDVGVLGPTRRGQDPVGAADTGTVSKPAREGAQR